MKTLLPLWLSLVVSALLLSASPGRAQGTLQLVANIARLGNDANPEYLLVHDGVLYFVASQSTSDAELWRYDGTSATQVTDIWADSNGSAGEPVVYDNKIYLRASDGTTGVELWRYDPATGQAELVADINPGGFSSNPQWLTVYDGKLYFQANDGTQTELWHYDAATGTASLAADINPGTFSSTPSWLTVYDGKLYFAAALTDPRIDFEGYGQELWQYDGTSASLVADMFPGEDSSSPSWLTVYDGTLYFQSTDGRFGRELWQHDGTSTAMVANIASSQFSPSSHPEYLTVYQNRLYFFAKPNSTTGRELWTYDAATAEATRALSLTAGSLTLEDRGHMTVYDGALYFRAIDQIGGQGAELWRFDGTTASLIGDIYPGIAASSPEWLTVYDGRLFFAAEDGTNGVELWSYTAATNNPPVATDDVAATMQDTPVDIDVLANDSDPDDDPLTIESFTQPANGQVTDAGGGLLIYTPATGFTGDDGFTYTVGDGRGGMATANVTVSVSSGTIALYISEVVTVSDAPGLMPALLLMVSEAISVSDDPNLLPALLLAVAETIQVNDEPSLLPALMISVAETISVTDAPGLTPALLLAIQETIAVSDDPALLASLMLRIQETISVNDAFGFLEPEDPADALVDAVSDLMDNGALTEGQAQSLLKKLDQIRKQVESGRYRVALNQLSAFTSQVESFRADGTLTDLQADALLAQALALAAQIDERWQNDPAKTDEALQADAALPTEYALSPAYPNPFNPSTNIAYALPEAAHVRLVVYDALGRQVAVLVDREQAAGLHTASFDAAALPSGLYVYRIEVGPFTQAQAMLLVK